MSSLSISEDSLAVPPSLFLREVKIEEGEIVGSGSYGTVLKAKWYGTDVAVKKLHDIFFKALNTSDFRTGILRNLARELNILVQLSHPNIVQFYGVYKSSESSNRSTSLELSMDTYIVQELMCCSLDIRNLQRPRLTFQNVVDISLSVSSGLQYLHDRHDPIIHRDLATKNILLGYNGVAKIGDLGVAKVLNQNQSNMLTRQPGTELYMPPEVKIQGVAYDTKIDIYSFGVVMLEVSIGRSATAREAFEVAQCGSGMIKLVPEVERREEDFKELGELHPLRVLILKCLGNRDERPSAKIINANLMELTQMREYGGCELSPIIAPGIPSPRVLTPLISPQDSSENKQLSERNLALEEEVQLLLTDKEFLQKKLDSYLREDRAEESSGSNSKEMTKELQRRESEVHQLMEENAMLQVALSEKENEMERLSKVSSPPSSLTDTEMRDQRGLLLQRMNKLEKRDLESQERIAALRKENETLKRELDISRSQSSSSTTSSSYGPPSSQYSSTTTTSGTLSSPSSIETLTPTLSTLQTSLSTSTTTGSSDPTTSSSTTMTSSSSSSSSATGSSQSSVPDKSLPTPAEYKKIKKQLERYKSVNIELDQRLKDAKLELQRYQGQQGNTDIMYQMDVQRLSAENARLQSQLDTAVNENGRLRSDLVNHRRY
jgi:serine/threonine protein kinase